MLCAAVCKLLGEAEEVFHDERLRGKFSATLYQVDVLWRQADENRFGEAKDYSVSGNKVGRADLQKLGGALGDTDVEGGIFFSATDYTVGARKYAEASEQINSKPIRLFSLTPYTETDSEGRILRITLEIRVMTPDYERAKFEPVWSEEGKRQLVRATEQGALLTGIHKASLGEIYDSEGEVLTTVWKLTARGFAQPQNAPDKRALASFPTPSGHIRVGGELVGIRGITYDIPFHETVEEVTISSEGQAKLVVKDMARGLDRVVTDVDLRRVAFAEGGEAVLGGGPE